MSLLFTVGFKAQDSAGTTGAGHLYIANPDAFYAVPHTLQVHHGFTIVQAPEKQTQFCDVSSKVTPHNIVNPSLNPDKATFKRVSKHIKETKKEIRVASVKPNDATDPYHPISTPPHLPLRQKPIVR